MGRFVRLVVAATHRAFRGDCPGPTRRTSQSLNAICPILALRILPAGNLSRGQGTAARPLGRPRCEPHCHVRVKTQLDRSPGFRLEGGRVASSGLKRNLRLRFRPSGKLSPNRVFRMASRVAGSSAGRTRENSQDGPGPEWRSW
jgi:hypothetical protein